MKQRIWKSTTYLTPGDTIGSCIISSNGRVITIYAQLGNRRTTFKTPDIWLKNFTENTLIACGNRGMEFESGATEDTQAVWMFPLYSWFSSLLIISSLDFGPVQMASAQVFITCQRWCSFPIRRISQNVAIELYRSVVGLMGSYNCIRRIIVSFLVSLSFCSLILAVVAQQVCA